MTGKVADFNRITGRGLIASKTSGKVSFHLSQVVAGKGKLDAGDQVEFELGDLDGVPQALAVSVLSRHMALQQRTLKAHSATAVAEGAAGIADKQEGTTAPATATPFPAWPGLVG
ncbi:MULTISPECIES: cold shock domain-containing protein [unclassified Variovorax]|nr:MULTISPECIES: cold shock domain-containing protein [unclassified Variovorax]